jgi:hypothetical protein
MISPQDTLLAANNEINTVEDEIGRLQARLVIATQKSRLSKLVRRMSFHIDTLLSKALRQAPSLSYRGHVSIMEKKMTLLRSRLIAIKRGRNNLTPLCKIPNEVLVQILLHIQTSPVREPQHVHHARLCSFTHNKHWHDITLVCVHMYETAMSTPELWTYVDLAWPPSRVASYLSRSKSLSLIVNWLVLSDSEKVSTRWEESVPLARSCYARAHAVNMVQRGMRHHDPQGVEHVIDQPNSALTVLHVYLGSKHYDFSRRLSLHPALVELSITRARLVRSLGDGIDIPIPTLPQLSRLHLSHMLGDSTLSHLFELLKHNPGLSELVLSDFNHIPSGDPHPGSHERSVKMPHLRSLILIVRPEVICCFMRALSPDLPALEELVVEGALRPHGHLWPSEFREVFPVVIALWNNVASARTTTASGGTTDTEACASLSLVGQYIWSPSSGNGDKNVLWLEVQHRDPAPGLKFRLRTLYDVDHHHEELFQAHNIEFDTLQINGLMPGSRGWRSTPWTARLDEILERIRVGRGMDREHGITRLRFIKCLVEVPGLEDWVQVQASRKIRIVNTIEFVGCGDDGPTMADYEALRDSRVVENVKWI